MDKRHKTDVTSSEQASREIRRLIKEAIRVPGGNWLLHPSIPLWLFKRHPKAQRNSVLSRLRKCAGVFDVDKAGLPRFVPNSGALYAVTGATRCEFAIESMGKDATLPGELWPEEQSEKEMANFFLDELRHVEPGIGTKHSIALVANRRDAKLVDVAIKKVPMGFKSLGAFYFALGLWDGENTLRKTALEIRRIRPRGKEFIPGAIIRGTAILVSRNQAISNKWKKKKWSLALERARTSRARSGGNGSIAEHTARILQ